MSTMKMVVPDNTCLLCLISDDRNVCAGINFDFTPLYVKTECIWNSLGHVQSIYCVLCTYLYGAVLYK